VRRLHDFAQRPQRAQDGTRHPLQQIFLENFALQCGYCTPGMLITAIELLQDKPDPTEREVREALSGNICRCSGYQAIVDAVLIAARQLRAARANAQASPATGTSSP
jgi:carbon-monoxide dehydrogenase small subunit